jgi:hypothetical protein
VRSAASSDRPSTGSPRILTATGSRRVQCINFPAVSCKAEWNTKRLVFHASAECGTTSVPEVMPKIDRIPETARSHAPCIAGHDVDDLKRIDFIPTKVAKFVDMGLFWF